MAYKLAFWASLIFGVLSLAFIVTNIVLLDTTYELRKHVEQRVELISNNEKLVQADQQLVTALAQIALQTKDPAFRDLLAAQGITIKATTDAHASPAPQPNNKNRVK